MCFVTLGEITVGDVSSPDNSGIVVRDHGFVVLAFAEGIEIEDQSKIAKKRAETIGVEDTQRDIECAAKVANVLFLSAAFMSSIKSRACSRD